MAKVTGIGGVFIKCEDPEKMNNWYKNTLGLNTNDYGVGFEFVKPGGDKGYLQLGTFKNDTDYFGAQKQKAMLNLRVDNLDELLLKLKKDKVNVVSELQEFEYGKFIHIEDIDGNRIELWEPVDKVFELDASPKQSMY